MNDKAKILKTYNTVIGLLESLPLDNKFYDQGKPSVLSDATPIDVICKNMRELFERLMIALPISKDNLSDWENCQGFLGMNDTSSDDLEVLVTIFDKAYELIAPYKKPNPQLIDLYSNYIKIYKNYQDKVGTLTGSGSSYNNANNQTPKDNQEIIRLIMSMILSQINLFKIKDFIELNTLHKINTAQELIKNEGDEGKLIYLFHEYAQMLYAILGFNSITSNATGQTQTALWEKATNPILDPYQKLYQKFVKLEENYDRIINNKNTPAILDKTSPNDIKVLLQKMLDFVKTKFNFEQMVNGDYSGFITSEDKESIQAALKAVLEIKDLKESQEVRDKVEQLINKINHGLRPIIDNLNSYSNKI